MIPNMLWVLYISPFQHRGANGKQLNFLFLCFPFAHIEGSANIEERKDETSLQD